MKYFNFPNNFKPIFVDWAITQKCYLNCTHCRYRGTKKSTTETPRHRELNKRQALELAKEINQLKPKWVLIEGGEPFLRKDIFDIIKTLKLQMDTDAVARSLRRSNLMFGDCHAFGSQRLRRPSNPWLNSRPIYIISSGMGFNESLAKKCKEIGVKLMISLDSAIENTYKKIRIGAKLSDAVNAIKIAQKFEILDSINVTLQELNASIKEIKAIGKLAKELKVKSINFFGIKPNSACATNSLLVSNFEKLFSEIINIGNKYEINVKVDEPFFKPWTETFHNVFARSKTTKQSPTFEIATPPEGRLAMTSEVINHGPIVAEGKSGCIFGEYLFIEPDGTTKPCSFSPLSYREIGFDVIKKIQDKTNRKGKCGKCSYQLECGGCRVRTYTLTGDWFESDPFCPL